jgi:DnaD/phage-associated family protein
MIDYFKQMNAFFENDVAELYQLNNSEVALWCALAHINNKARGLQEFRVASSVLTRKSGLKEANFFKTRNSLNQKGLVIVKSGKGSTAATYQMKVLYDLSIYSVDNSSDNGSGNSNDNSIENGSGNSSALSLNLTTPNLTNNNNDHERARTFWTKNVQIMESPIVLENIDKWVQDFAGNDELVILAMKTMLDNNVRSYKYMSKILQDWESKGFKSVSDVNIYEQQRQAKKQAKRSNFQAQQPVQKETLPDWAQPGYTPEQDPASKPDDGLKDSLAGLKKLRQEHGI